MLQTGYNDIKRNSFGDYNVDEYGQIETPDWQDSNYIDNEPDIKNVSRETSASSTPSATITAPPALPNNPFMSWFGIKQPIAPLSSSKVAQIKAAMGTSGVGALNWFSLEWQADTKKAIAKISVPKTPVPKPVMAPAVVKTLPTTPTAPAKVGVFKNISDMVASQSGSWLHPPVAATKTGGQPSESFGLQTVKPEGNFTYENIRRTVGMSGIGDSGTNWGLVANAFTTVVSDFAPKPSTPSATPTTVVVQQPASSKSNMTTYLLIGGAGLLGVGTLVFMLRPKPAYR